MTLMLAFLIQHAYIDSTAATITLGLAVVLSAYRPLYIAIVEAAVDRLLPRYPHGGNTYHVIPSYRVFGPPTGEVNEKTPPETLRGHTMA